MSAKPLWLLWYNVTRWQQRRHLSHTLDFNNLVRVTALKHARQVICIAQMYPANMRRWPNVGLLLGQSVKLLMYTDAASFFILILKSQSFNISQINQHDEYGLSRIWAFFMFLSLNTWNTCSEIHSLWLSGRCLFLARTRTGSYIPS